jgi:hypothetical protein
MWRIQRESGVEAMREIGIEDPLEYVCLCGCGNTVLYGGDDRALWFCPLLTDRNDGYVHTVGFETADEFLAFVGRAKLSYGDRLGVPTEHWERMIEAMLPHVPGVS